MADLVTLDLDDTLLTVSDDYTEAKEEFFAYLELQYGIEWKKAEEIYSEKRSESLEKHGLNLESFPYAFEHALREIASNPPESEIELVRSIAKQAFKDESEYRQRGFMEGSREMVEYLDEIADELHLITAGVEELQQRKINALELEQWIDEFHIVEHEMKEDRLHQLCSKKDIDRNNVYHIGNSAKSDIEPAVNAGVNAVYLPRNEWMKGGDGVENHDNVDVFESPHHFIRRHHFFRNFSQEENFNDDDD